MGRNLYILAATLLLFSLISFGMAFTGFAHEPGSPADSSLWRTIGIFLFLISLVVGLLGTLQSLFEQAESRAERHRIEERNRRRRS